MRTRNKKRKNKKNSQTNKVIMCARANAWKHFHITRQCDRNGILLHFSYLFIYRLLLCFEFFFIFFQILFFDFSAIASNNIFVFFYVNLSVLSICLPLIVLFKNSFAVFFKFLFFFIFSILACFVSISMASYFYIYFFLIRDRMRNAHVNLCYT